MTLDGLQRAHSRRDSLQSHCSAVCTPAAIGLRPGGPNRAAKHVCDAEAAGDGVASADECDAAADGHRSRRALPSTASGCVLLCSLLTRVVLLGAIISTSMPSARSGYSGADGLAYATCFFGFFADLVYIQSAFAWEARAASLRDGARRVFRPVPDKEDWMTRVKAAIAIPARNCSGTTTSLSHACPRPGRQHRPAHRRDIRADLGLAGV